MTDNFYLALAAVLLLPLLPAYIIYKFLPASETNVEGPYKKLNLKLKGAFAGYFLLVLLGIGLQYGIMNNAQKKLIEELHRNIADSSMQMQEYRSMLAANANPVVDWKVKGVIVPGEKEGTRFFFDDGTTSKNPDGSFELIKRSIAAQGKAKAPQWICVYNPSLGYRVVSLNREVNHSDIQTYRIAFNDDAHEIFIRKAININSNSDDSVVAVAGFLEKNPQLKTAVLQTQPSFFQKAEAVRISQNKLKMAHMVKRP